MRGFWLLAIAPLIMLVGCGKAQQGQVATLRVADQFSALQSVLAAAGEDKPSGYRVEWSDFISGPPIIAGETGGSIDLGWMAETPLVFAQAAGSPVKVVAVSRGAVKGAHNIALVVGAKSPVRSIAGLKGRTIGFIPGTVAQYLVMRALSGAGLSITDVKPVHLTSTTSATLNRGVVDASVVAEPFLSQGLKDGTLRELAAGAEPNTPGYGYLVASDAALADPARAKMIGDFITHLARANGWARAHPDKTAPFVARALNVAPDTAELILRRNQTRFAPIDDVVVARHQQEVDFFHQLKLIRERLDASRMFDHRFDKLVAAAETGR